MKKIISILVSIFLLMSLGILAVDVKEKVEFKEVIFKTDFGPVEISWKIEIYFSESGKLIEAVIESYPRATWSVVPKLETAYESTNGKYFLMFDILDCPVEFLNSKKYSDRLILMAGFHEASPEEISPIPKLLLEAAKEKKPVIIKAGLTIEGLFRWVKEDGKEQGLINQGEIKILEVAFKEPKPKEKK